MSSWDFRFSFSTQPLYRTETLMGTHGTLRMQMKRRVISYNDFRSVSNQTFRCLDRQSQLVYTANSVSKDLYVKYNGRKSEIGVYVYFLKGKSTLRESNIS